MCTGLTFCQARPRRPGRVRRVERLDHDALVAGVERVVQHARAACSADGRSTPGMRACGRRPAPRPARRAAPSAARRAGRAPSRCRQSKKNGLQQHAAAGVPTAEAAHRVLERARPAVVVAAPGSRRRARPTRHGSARTSATSSGTPVGDLAQGAGPDPHLVAVAVHLDAGAVELELDGDLGAEVGQRARPAGRPGLASIGRTGTADLQAHRVERHRAAGQGERGGRAAAARRA